MTSAEPFDSTTVVGVCTCTKCKSLFTEPKILPRCLHTFCKDCIVALIENDSEVTCPICHAFDNIEDVDMLPSNGYIQRVIEAIRVQDRADRGKLLPGEKCPHASTLSKPTLCEHCQAPFCKPCLFQHLESVRLETAWICSRFPKRWQKVMQNLAVNETSIRTAVSEQTANACQEIKESSEKFKETLKGSVEELRARLLKEVRQIGQAQKDRVEQFLTLRGSNVCGPLSQKVAEFGERSVGSMSVQERKEIVKLYVEVCRRNKEISEMEELQSIPKSGKIQFTPDKNLPDLVEQIRESGGSSVTLKFHDKHLVGKKVPVDIARLHAAAISGDLETVKMVLDDLPPPCERYAVEHRDFSNFSKTTLIQAAENGHLDIVKYLVLEKRADLDVADDDGTCLLYACDKGRINVVKFLLEHKPECLETCRDSIENTPLCRAVIAGHLPLVKVLVEDFNANIEHHGDSDSTPLMIAAREGHLEIAKYLADKGAHLRAFDDYEGTRIQAVHIAARCGKVEILRFLFDVDPKLANEETLDKCTPLHEAAQFNELEAIEFLMKDPRVDGERKNKFKENVLLTAAFFNSFSVVKYLLKEFPKLNCYAEGTTEREAIELALNEEEDDDDVLNEMRESYRNSVLQQQTSSQPSSLTTVPVAE